MIPTTWILEIKHRLSALAVSAFTLGAISPVLKQFSKMNKQVQLKGPQSPAKSRTGPGGYSLLVAGLVRDMHSHLSSVVNFIIRLQAEMMGTGEMTTGGEVLRATF